MTGQARPEWHGDAGGVRVGYVMTHYPKAAQTFIANEIDAVTRNGIAVMAFAMNPPDAWEICTPGAAARADRTHYLKPMLVRGFAMLLQLTVRHPRGMATAWFRALRSGGVHPVRLLRRIAHLAQAALIARRCAASGIERLHAHFGLAPATLCWLACAILRAQGRDCKFSFTIHGYHDFVDQAESRLDLKAADAIRVVCISDYTRSQLCMVTKPADWNRYAVIRCGIDLEQFSFRAPSPVGDGVRLLAVGRLSAEKGLLVLLEAVAALRRDGVAARLLLVGDGPQRAELAIRAAALDIAEHVEFAGEFGPDGVADALRRSDIFCMASFSEGLPVSIMEAMATGVPVVTTAIAGIPELAIDGETALTVPPARADCLAAAVQRLHGDPALARDLAAAARDRVCRHHDLDRTGAAMARLLTGAEAA